MRVHNETLSVVAMCVGNPDPDDVKDVLGKYEGLEKLAESFFVTKPTRQAPCEESGRSRPVLPPIFVGSSRRTTAGFGVFE